MASENLPAIETDLRLSKSSFKKSSESSFSDSSTASSSLSMLSAVSSLDQDHKLNKKSYFDKTVLKSASFFANGIYEYNQCIFEFEKFAFQRLKEFNSKMKQTKKSKHGLQPAFLSSKLASTSDDPSGNICGYVCGVPVYDGFISRLRDQTPWMAPEEQD